MHSPLTGNFIHRLQAFDGFEGCLGLELGAVLFSLHNSLLLSSFSGYCAVGFSSCLVQFMEYIINIARCATQL
jgi:hypothetical protein